MYNFDSYNVLLAIATNIPVLLMTAGTYTGISKDGGQQRVSTSWNQMFLIVIPVKVNVCCSVVIV